MIDLPGALEIARMFRNEYPRFSTLAKSSELRPDRFGFHPLATALATARLLCSEIDTDRSMVAAVMLAPLARAGAISDAAMAAEWGDDIASLVRGLTKVNELYRKSASVESDNFRKLLLTFAADIRVIIIMIVNRLALMRAINHNAAENHVRETAYEANYLYAPLAHRLGLYAIKRELEDLSLKYSNREIYTSIAHQLNQTRARRDAYITDFIAPVKAKLEAAGIRFDIKGRTKSIYSIWSKLKRQKNTLDDIFDLFAIRIIIDCEDDRKIEADRCWDAYSIVTDMYEPNVDRLKDWISVPKENGYESLHITVKGPEERWVEVQIRTRRMDEIAEKGLAAHWKYKGIQSENGLDAWMNNVRDILESPQSAPMQLMRDFKMDVYSHEVFVFTPKGDLYKLPQGATVLDFAFNIHTNVGMRCVGARIDGRNRKINYRLTSGDMVEVLTSPQQEPNPDWLTFAVTSKARAKIRAVLKDRQNASAAAGRELLERRLRNRKLDIDEASLNRTITGMGYKDTTTFFASLGRGLIAIDDVVAAFEELRQRDEGPVQHVSAGTYVMPADTEEAEAAAAGDVITIGENVKGVKYRLSKCCNPIYGDDVFGFLSTEGAVKIHRSDCPNAVHLRQRFPYRVIRTRWSGRAGEQFLVKLSVVGKDDIGIVTNISSIINKEKDTSLRSIAIDAHDGLFSGILTVGINDTSTLQQLIRKISTVKGVKEITRA